MVHPVGFRFRPTDEEIIDHYIRLKNLDSNTSHMDQVISTVNICSFDPWDLPSQSKTESRDQVWYFFGRKENKYNRGDRQSRKTKSGFWKKTGVTMDILRKPGNREKMGEKRFLVFHLKGSKTNWVMHEYLATFLSPPNQSMAYTLCKVEFKGEASEITSYSGSDIEQNHSLIPHMNNIGGLSAGSEGSSFELLDSQELQNPCQFSGFLDLQEETQLEDAMRSAFNNLSSYCWESLLVDDEQSKIISMQEDCSDHIPQNSLSGVFVGHSSDSDISNNNKQNVYYVP